MANIKRDALFFLYREQRNAKIALGNAESKPGVKLEELENLRRKVNAVDFLIPLAISTDDATDTNDGHKLPVEVVKRALLDVKRLCEKTEFFEKDCSLDCPFFNSETYHCPFRYRYPDNWEIDHWKEGTK